MLSGFLPLLTSSLALMESFCSWSRIVRYAHSTFSFLQENMCLLLVYSLPKALREGAIVAEDFLALLQRTASRAEESESRMGQKVLPVGMKKHEVNYNLSYKIIKTIVKSNKNHQNNRHFPSGAGS